MEAGRALSAETVKTLKLLRLNPVGFFGFGMVVAFLLFSFVGPLLVPFPDRADVSAIYQGPSAAHWLGTDFQGKDNLALLVHGGREIMIVAFVAGVLTMGLAVLVGSFSAFLGGLTDTLLMEITNIWLTIPRFPILIIIATFLKLNDIWGLAVLIAILSWPGFARQVRAQFLSLKRRDYVESAQLLHLGTPHIIFREMLPNMMSFVAVSLIFAMTGAIYQQTGLVFLGLVPFSGANWGVLLSLAFAKGAIYQRQAAWSVIAPVAAIALFQLSLVWLSRSLEEVFNPRLRTGV
jgi:peptide/nickel transport system permease protein